MGRLRFDMDDSIEFQQAVSHYLKLAHIFTQLTSGEAAEPLREFWNNSIVKRDEKTWMTDQEYSHWLSFNAHMVKQMWGSTAGGWPGMGGAAMSEYYTTVIENSHYRLACIYYGGRLAYICEMDDKYQSYIEKGYRGLPGIPDCRTKLTVLYTGK